MTRARQALERAVELYQGDLLPSCYDEWILPERDRLRQTFLRALERLTVLLERARDYEKAVAMAQRMLRHDPLHEPTYRRLMHVYAAQGQRAAALRVYHTCVSVLERELGAEPSRATHQVYEDLIHREEGADSYVAPQPPKGVETHLVGRKSEWAQLQATWRGLPARGAHMAVISGEAGIGKTRLAEEVVTWVSRQNMTIAVARCYAAEGELAYAPVATWLRNDSLRASLPRLTDIWLTEVARLVPDVLVERPDLPPPGPLVESWQRQRLFEALARAILAVRQPLLLLLDDAQWCDRETLEWLHYLFRFDPRAPLLLVVTLRAEEVTAGHPLKALLAALQRNQQVTEVPLGALEASETAALAAQVAGRQLDPALATTLHQETEGNPLFVVETVRADLFEQRHGSKLPPTVQTVLGTRLEQLSPLAQEAARLASVIGRAFTFSVLTQASSMDEEALVLALDELWQRRIVREQGAGATDAYDFSHPQLREVAYATLSTMRRRFLHRQVAQALEWVHADAPDRVSGQIAAHYEQAGLPEQAIAYYRRAGEVAVQVYAHSDALALFQRALALLEMAPHEEAQRSGRQETAARLHERTGDILALTGQLEQARDAYERALALVAASERIWQAHLHCKIGNTWEAQRRNESALHAYMQAENILGQEPNEAPPEWWQQWIEIQMNRLQVHYWLAHVPEMTELIAKTQPIVEQYGTAAEQATFFQGLSLMMIRQERYVGSEKALGYAQAALAASQETGNSVAIGWARFNLGGAHLLCNNFDEAEEHLQAAVALGEQTGDVMLQAKGAAFLTLVCRRRGQVLEAQRANARAEGLAKRVQDAEFLGLAKANSAWLAWREGNAAKVKANGKAALEWWRQTPVVCAFQWTALWPLIGTALAQNRLAEALDHARTLLSPEQQRLPEAIALHVEAAISAWDSDQRDAAHAQLQQAVTLAQEPGYL